MQIHFYTNIPNVLNFLAHYLWYTVLSEHKTAIVYFSEEQYTTIRLSNSLWSFEETSFIAHCILPSKIAKDTPIWLSKDLNLYMEANLKRDILINLTPLNLDINCLQGYCDNLLEIVGRDSEAITLGREKFKLYKAQNLPIIHNAF